ncbi:MAG: 1-deoxy-D-xylulose-5-phosphate synthase [Bacilli bacterium]|nr:1-deoxy-D-xylulose-5-phosphate synthase [Bacilli bacterium]
MKEIKHVDLKNIKDPSFLKDLSYKELNTLSSDIASFLVDITSKNGGHLSSNLGVVDATIALCRVFDFKKDKIIFDVGHQCYTYKLLTGRNLETIRKDGGISGFQKKEESEYDHYEAGHSSTSISAALGMAVARDLNKENYEVISFIGDSSFVNGLSMEAINNTANLKNHKIIVIVNDNDMSISKAVGGLSHVFRNISVSDFYRKSRNAFKKIMSLTRIGRKIYNSFRSFKNWIKRLLIRTSILDSLGFSFVGPIDGHDIKELEKCLIQAKKNDKPTMILIKTVKGKGYKYAEEDKDGKWHGVPPFNKETGEFYNASNISWSQYFSHLISKEMKDKKNVVAITPGTGYGSGITSLFNEFPDRTFDVGIAEEHALIFASGLASSGIHPIICIYSTFLQRAYDELSHDLARMNLDSTILVDRAGLVGLDGETHQGLYDEAYLASIPNVTISMPSNTLEAKLLLDESFLHHGPFVIRFPRETITKSTSSYSLEYGKWLKLTEGKEKVIISVGPILNKLKQEIISHKLDIALYNALYIKPFDTEALDEIMNYQKVIIYDPYSTDKGLTEIVSNYLMNKGYQGKVISKAVPDTFVKQGSIEEQRKRYHLTVKEILDL